MLSLLLTIAPACGGDAVAEDSGAGGEGSGSASSTTEAGSSTTSLDTTTSSSTDAGSDSTTAASTGSSSDEGTSSSGGTTESRACPDGVELVGLASTCVSHPVTLDPQPAYDVFGAWGLEGIMVSNDTGVSQYREVDGDFVEVSTVPLPGHGQDIAAVYFYAREKIPGRKELITRLLVTVPDADRLAVVAVDESGLLTTASLLETGARPMGVGWLWDFEFLITVTANADDGTLSLFREQGPGALVHAATLDVGGTPRAVAANDQHIGVVDTLASTLTILSLDGLEIDQTNTIEVPAGPVSVFPMTGSDVGPPLFAVVSRDADVVTLFRVDDGSEFSSGDFPGGPSRAVIANAFWPPGALDEGQFWTGALAMTNTSSITIGMHGTGKGSPSLDRILGTFPTGDNPVSLALADTNDDGRGDFLTASPTSGLTVVVQQ